MLVFVLFFFQAEDGIRDDLVTGVQTCALPIWRASNEIRPDHGEGIEHDVRKPHRQPIDIAKTGEPGIAKLRKIRDGIARKNKRGFRDLELLRDLGAITIFRDGALPRHATLSKWDV